MRIKTTGFSGRVFSRVVDGHLEVRLRDQLGSRQAKARTWSLQGRGWKYRHTRKFIVRHMLSGLA